MSQIVEVQNFFDDPHFVRNFALTQPFKAYEYNPHGIWSGFRTPINNSKIEEEFSTKLEKENGRKIKDFSSYFHLNPKVSMHGFPHTDSDNPQSFAGVIYLNEQFPENCGTTIYEDLPTHKNSCNQYIVNYIDKMEVVYNTNLNIENKFKKQFSEECLNFKKYVLKKIKSVQFQFNKMICYPGYVLHSPDFYFGSNVKNSRLTIAFHGEFHAN